MRTYHLMLLLRRLYPSAGYPGWGGHFQRPRPQLYWRHELPHVQRPPVPGRLPPSAGCIYSMLVFVKFHSRQDTASMSLFRMEECARTLMPACTCAAAPEDSQAATASITRPCTVTQVHWQSLPDPKGRSEHPACLQLHSCPPKVFFLKCFMPLFLT